MSGREMEVERSWYEGYRNVKWVVWEWDRNVMEWVTHHAEFELSDGPLHLVFLTHHLHSNVAIDLWLHTRPVPVTLGLCVCVCVCVCVCTTKTGGTLELRWSHSRYQQQRSQSL